MPLPAGSDEHGPGHCFLLLTIAGDQQAAAQHIDRLIEFIVRVRDGPGEMSRDGELHGRKPSGPVLITQALAGLRRHGADLWPPTDGGGMPLGAAVAEFPRTVRFWTPRRVVA